jgi:hypothetical protein
METQTLINIGFACAGIFGGWWMKIIWDSIQSLRADARWPVDPLAEVDTAFVSLTAA